MSATPRIPLLLAALLAACGPAIETGGADDLAAAAPAGADLAAAGGADLAARADGGAADLAPRRDGALADLAPRPDGGADLAPAPDCSDGLFVRKNAIEWTLGDRTYPVGEVRHHCVDLPADAMRQLKTIVELSTVNLGNASCGTLRITAVTPSGKVLTSFGAQPGVASFYEAGRWAVTIKNEMGCDRYRVTLVI